MRINKYISDSGLCSRREADKMIAEGRITLNGRIAVIGDKVTPYDKVQADGHPVKAREETVYIAFHKPAGITCTTDRSEPDNILDYVNYPTRIFNIGRLDKPSEGLIFLTNNGDIVNKILRAGNLHEKEYLVTVNKPITESFIQQMSGGIPILGTRTKKCKVEQKSTNQFSIILVQGLNRQIRRMCEYLGYEVTRLIRRRIMNVSLEKLPCGEWRFLTVKEVAEINELTAESSNEINSSKTRVARSLLREKTEQTKTIGKSGTAPRRAFDKKYLLKPHERPNKPDDAAEKKIETREARKQGTYFNEVTVVEHSRKAKPRATNPKSAALRAAGKSKKKSTKR